MCPRGCAGLLLGLTRHPPPPARLQQPRKPKPTHSWQLQLPGQVHFDITRQKAQMGQAVTAVPFNRVYDFPGASRPGDARERARKRKCLGDVNAVKTLASGMHFSCPGKGRGVGNGAILKPNREGEKERPPVPVDSPHHTRACAAEPKASGLINAPGN